MIFRNIAMFPTFVRSPMAVNPPGYQMLSTTPGKATTPRRALEALRRFHAVGPSGHLRFHHPGEAP